ncbi:NAD-dependent epimerase/dehydratase family protein [Lutibacter sp. A80]|uniref:NAD-dependent epimerase/dehydratase family protein n=1 Tax=Lutibacter sp. A80 TaxID=2918453 RepID=UPI001F06E94D|nr:NAD-dependent epimerase/dehydratase family protein [Lutibacter sp. A80]UMB60775.1 NAD-dependent epimerase/dehydratase family protein [Lutibacter sp. A80]
MNQDRILITGASGQLGTVLTKKLQEKYGVINVIASDLRLDSNFKGIFETLDATDFDAIQEIVSKYKITQIYHLAAILSANGEKYPLNTWDINMKTFFNVLEISRLNAINRVFFPSSIAVFGDNIDRIDTAQYSNLTPSTVYGMSKVTGENWSKYYFEKYGLDIRSIRYPGVIGYQSLPGGGTTDYAVDIFIKAIKNENYECFLNSSTTLPMIYMDDVIRATIELMEAPKEAITVRTSYNLAGMSFDPAQLTKAIQKIYPDFKVSYNPDFRQKIADSWPMSIDDSYARKDWNWKPKFDIDAMTRDMVKNLKIKFSDKSMSC